MPNKKEGAAPSIAAVQHKPAATANPQKAIAQTYLSRPEVPTLFISRILSAKANDGHTMLGFFCPASGGEIEQARIVLTDDHVKRTIDLLCRQSGYYPTPGNVNDGGKKEEKPA